MSKYSCKHFALLLCCASLSLLGVPGALLSSPRKTFFREVFRIPVSFPACLFLLSALDMSRIDVLSCPILPCLSGPGCSCILLSRPFLYRCLGASLLVGSSSSSGSNREGGKMRCAQISIDSGLGRAWCL